MRTKKIYNKKYINKHFKRLLMKEKISVFIENIVLKIKDIKKFLSLEKKHILLKYTIKIVRCVIFLFMLFIIQKVLQNINWLPIKTIKSFFVFNDNNYFDYLIACLGVGGFLTALFFSNLSGVFSSKYSDLNSKISSTILNEYMNKKYFESIVNYLVLLIIELLCYVFNINLNFLITITTFLLTIRIIIIFIILSKRIFGFTNINYITLDTCQDIIYYFDKLKIAINYSKKESIIVSYRNIIRKRLDVLEELYIAFTKEKDIRGLCEFNEYVIDLLSVYCMDKNDIPFDALWYEEKVKPKSWFEADFFEVETGIRTGTSLRPSTEKNTNFFENYITEIILKSIDYLLKEEAKKELYELLNSYHLHFEKIKNSGEYKYWMDINNKISNKIISNNSILKIEDDDILAIVDLISLLNVDYILDFTNYSESMYNQINTCISSANQFVNSNKNCFILSSSRTANLIKKLKFEKKLEKRYITTDYYIKEYVFWEYNNYLIEYIESFPKLYENMINISDILQKNNKNISACIILSRMIEINNKIENSITRLFSIIKKINEDNKNFKYKKIDVDLITNKINETYIDSLMLYSSEIAKLNVEKYDYKKEKIDFYGECFYNLAQETFFAIIDEDYDKFKKLYEGFIIAVIICDEFVHKIVDSNDNINYKLSKYKIPLLQFMNISGYAIYYSHLVKKKEWEDVIKECMNRLLTTSKEQYEFLKKLAAIASIDKSIFCIDTFKTSFKQNFINFIKDTNYIKYKEFGPFSQKVVDSDDELLDSFSFSTHGFYYEFYDIFIHYYVNPKLKKEDRCVVDFSKKIEKKGVKKNG